MNKKGAEGRKKVPCWSHYQNLNKLLECSPLEEFHIHNSFPKLMLVLEILPLICFHYFYFLYYSVNTMISLTHDDLPDPNTQHQALKQNMR